MKLIVCCAHAIKCVVDLICSINGFTVDAFVTLQMHTGLQSVVPFGAWSTVLHEALCPCTALDELSNLVCRVVILSRDAEFW